MQTFSFRWVSLFVLSSGYYLNIFKNQFACKYNPIDLERKTHLNKKVLWSEGFINSQRKGSGDTDYSQYMVEWINLLQIISNQ